MSGDEVCFRHPFVKSSARCYRCHKSVCMMCRHHASRHYFCGRRCHWLFLGGELMRAVARRKRWWLIAWNSLITLLLLIELAIHHLGWTTAPSRADLSASTPVPGNAPVVDSLKALPTVVPPVDTVSQGDFAVEVSASAGEVVAVWRNGRPQQFSKIPTSGPRNIRVPLLSGMNDLMIAIWNTPFSARYTRRLRVHYRLRDIVGRPFSVERGSVRVRKLALTFDGGSSSSAVDTILAVLAEKQVRATMFLTGRFIEQYPQAVRKIVAAGHEVANHTYNHPHLTSFARDYSHEPLANVDRNFVIRQLTRTDSIFTVLTGHHMAPLWRAPFGEYNEQILSWAAQCGYRHIRWTKGFDTLDWVEDSQSSLYRTPEEMLRQIIARAAGENGLNGVIILMHLGTQRRNGHMHTILPTLIDQLQERGYSPVTVSELLRQ